MFLLMLMNAHFVVQVDRVDGVGRVAVVGQFGVVLGQRQQFFALGADDVAEVGDFDFLLLDFGQFVLAVLLQSLDVLQALLVVVAHLVEARLGSGAVQGQLGGVAEDQLEFLGEGQGQFAFERTRGRWGKARDP